MRVLLVQAASYFPGAEKAFPLGIMCLAAYARQSGLAEVDLLDMQLDTGNVDCVLARLRATMPDVLGIGAMTFDAPVMHELARRAKNDHPKMVVVAGGNHASCYPAEVMADANIDYLIRGEGEIAFGKLLQALDGRLGWEQVTNCVRRQDGQLVYSPDEPFVEDLDRLLFPDYEHIGYEGYLKVPRIGVVWTRKRYATIITSRGCPFNCAYCHRTLGKRLRPHGADYVVAEMEWLMQSQGVREFVFVDDLANLDRRRIQRIAQTIIERKLDVSLYFTSGLRGDLMDEETLRLLRQAGTYRVMFAFETGSERLQKLISKNLDLDKVLFAVEKAAELGILVNGAFMVGFPTETYEEMKATMRLALRSKLHTAAFLRVIAFRNTRLFDMARECGCDVPETFDQYNLLHTTVNLSDVPNRKIRRLTRWTLLRFYSSPRRIWRIAKLMGGKLSQVPYLFWFLFRKSFIW